MPNTSTLKLVTVYPKITLSVASLFSILNVIQVIGTGDIGLVNGLFYVVGLILILLSLKVLMGIFISKYNFGKYADFDISYGKAALLFILLLGLSASLLFPVLYAIS